MIIVVDVVVIKVRLAQFENDFRHRQADNLHKVVPGQKLARTVSGARLAKSKRMQSNLWPDKCWSNYWAFQGNMKRQTARSCLSSKVSPTCALDFPPILSC